ncbi:hypothetical protein L7F22_043207 [Adiantum nelumboides]|nr:hypothetical protein [Adiantum nelumboides]
MRWVNSTLLCLQEIAKDYLVEFFSDGYILTAHAHRVTIMAQDFDTLWRLHFCFNGLLQPVPIRDMRTMDILNIPPLHPRARQTEPSRTELNRRSTQSRVERNAKDGQADEGHEQVRVIEETKTVWRNQLCRKMSKAWRCGACASTDKAQERQGKGSASQGPSNMEPLSDETIILTEINEENEEELQVLIKLVPLHAEILLPKSSEEDYVFTLDRQDFLCMCSFYNSSAMNAIVIALWYFSSSL